MSRTGNLPDDWVKTRKRLQRRDSREKLRALARKPLTILAVAVILVLAVAAGVVAGLKSEGITGRYCQKTFVPAYFDASAWPQATVGKHRPSAMILNPSTGIGAGSGPNSGYQSAARQAHAKGIMILGYSSTAFGSRPISQIEADVRNYKAWYGVNGIFLDSVSGTASALPYYRKLARYIHQTIPGSSVWLNAGNYPDQRYMSIGDVLMVFEGTYAQYRDVQVPSWARNFPATRFANTIYGAVTSSEANSAISLSRSRNAGYVFVTNLTEPNPYDALPGYWSSEVTAISSGCGT
jgi:Spherulation-specific family 4